MVQWTSIPAVHISTKTHRNPGKHMVGEATRHLPAQKGASGAAPLDRSLNPQDPLVTLGTRG